MKTRLARLESRLQTFVESSLNPLPGGQRQSTLARKLVEALEETLVESSGTVYAWHTYTIYLHPQSLALWQNQQQLLASLSTALQDAATEAGVTFGGFPVLNLAADDSLPLDGVQIRISGQTANLGFTAAMPALNEIEREAADPRPANAFLMLNNSQIFPLRLVVVNIGRRMDNQVVIEDPRVSRNHAQLRAVRGQYVLFDLSSTGGTFVNGVRMTQEVLKPGDVISLAGFPIIYGEDNPVDDTTASDDSDTHPTDRIN